MRILGIDPGTAILGWGLIECQGSNLKCQDFGIIKTSAKLDDAKRLEKISRELKKIVTKSKPDRVAVERLFFLKNQKTIFTIAQARGVVLLVSAEEELPVFEYTSIEVKKSVASYGWADKQQMQKMVKLHLGLKEIPKPDDAADALAVAITCANTAKWG
jgi:crossover junction endodeoxyribonuclease RuvC